MRIILLIVFMFISSSSFASNQNQQGYTAFAATPILHEGRIKPLDTFARAMLINIHGKESIYDDVNKQKISSIQWMAEVLFNPKNAYKRPIFNIANPAVTNALNLKWNKKHRYSFAVLTKAIIDNFETVDKLQKLPENKRSPEEHQLVEVYLKSLHFFQVSRSLSLLWPNFSSENEHLTEWLSVEDGERFSYMDMLKKQAFFSSKIEGLRKKNPKEMLPEERAFVELWYGLEVRSKDSGNQSFNIVPPQWDQEGKWHSPWEVLNLGQGSHVTANYLSYWKDMSASYQDGDMQNWHKKAVETQVFAHKISSNYASSTLLKLEVLYNTLQPFKVGVAFYIFSFICLIFSMLFWLNTFSRIAVSSLVIGGIVHLFGMALRVIIMQRPPVATLYESIIFVALIGVIFALIIEYKRRDRTGVIIGSLLGSTLLFIGMRYALEGDTMGMLSAVLNTNFWLATHVVTITIGYGCCLVAGVLGHVYLVQRLLKYKTNRLNDILKNMLAVSLVAVFFSVLGTILGGIWADQSWGRFWGWDPKENGAMFICLWLIWLVHGRLSGIIKPFGFAIGMVLTNITVALAWFGVNLLGVGLHSYGFTGGIAMNLAIFCISEILFVIIIGGIIFYREKALCKQS